MTNHVVFDIDGTLANITHRLPYITGEGKKDWDAFHKACVEDEPILEMIITTQAFVKTGYFVHLVTGRMETVRNQTEMWLFQNLVRYSNLFMRPESDYRPDFELKREFLNLLRSRGQEPILVFDDRQQVVDMWRSEGIRCCQVAKGDY